MASTTSLLGTAVLGAAVLASTGDYPNYNADRFQWEGHCWELVSDPDMATALVKPDGNAVAQEQFAARLANILRLNVGNLYVTETATIDTAVIARLFVDLFTAHKIGADELAANSVTAEKIVASSDLSAKVGNFLEINAEQITGGSFVGETFEGGTFTGGLFKTSDALPGKVYFSDYGYKDSGSGVTGPGIRIVPPDVSGYAAGYTPAIGPNGNGMVITGGRATSGGQGFAIFAPEASQLRYVKGAADSTIAVWADKARLSSTATNGATAYIDATPTKATINASNSTAVGTISVKAGEVDISSTTTSGSYCGFTAQPNGSAQLVAESSPGNSHYIEVTEDGIYLVKVVDGDATQVELTHEFGMD